jgi:hypothetical protein
MRPLQPHGSPTNPRNGYLWFLLFSLHTPTLTRHRLPNSRCRMSVLSRRISLYEQHRRILHLRCSQ